MTTIVTRTFLEMRRPEQLRAAESPSPDASIARERCDVELYRRLYADVGATHHWHDRDAWPDERLAEHLARPDVSVWILRVDGLPAGYFELLRHSDHSVEIAYFGLAGAYLGRGLGKFLLSCAVREAWTLGAARVWLHTCTLDHPAALPNYEGRGFRPIRTETYEVELEPRASPSAPEAARGLQQ
jgi:GNAT superfamily N-acetyltransferase